MTAYNPPEFQFSGLIFNPLIYEQDEATSSSSGTFVDLTTDNLYTNNIQGKTAVATTSLYTLSSGIVSIGGSILTALYYITNVHFFYNALKDQLVSMRFNLYAMDMISTDYYADIAGTALSVSVRASPQFTGDTTFCNGIYTILAGTTRLLNLISTSLEAPTHYLYNVAKTINKKTFFGGATNIYEEYYVDGANPTIASSNIQVLVSATPLVANTATYQITAGTINLVASSSVSISSPITPNYDARYSATTGTSVSSSIGYVIGSTLAANITIGTVMTTLTNIQILDVGVYQLNAIVVINNPTATAGTVDRVMVYVGYGAINNNTNNIATGQWSKISFGTTVLTGRNFNAQISMAIVITSIPASNNYLCLAAINSGAGPFNPTAAPLSMLQVVRIG